MIELKYPLFDGEKLWEGAAVTIEDGVITSVAPCDPAECGGCRPAASSKWSENSRCHRSEAEKEMIAHSNAEKLFHL